MKQNSPRRRIASSAKFKNSPIPTTNKAPWSRSEIGAAAAAVVALLALGLSCYQFFVTARLQEQALVLQERAANSDRLSKVSELFQKYQEEAYLPRGEAGNKESPSDRVGRHNKALFLLNTIHILTKGDPEWEQIVHYALERHLWLATERRVTCLKLTKDFRRLLEERLVEKNPAICSDLTYEQ